jgi:hypothetical protein
VRGVAYRLDEGPRSLSVCSNDFGSNHSACRIIDTFRINFEGKQGQCENAQTFDELCGRVDSSVRQGTREEIDLDALARVSGVGITVLTDVNDPFSSMVARKPGQRDGDRGQTTSNHGRVGTRARPASLGIRSACPITVTSTTNACKITSHPHPRVSV